MAATKKQVASDRIVRGGSGSFYFVSPSGSEWQSKESVDVEMLVAKRDRIRLEVMERSGELMETSAVHFAAITLVKSLAESINSLPDVMERRAGLSLDQMAVLVALCDEWRVGLVDRAKIALSVSVESLESVLPPVKLRTGRKVSD